MTLAQEIPTESEAKKTSSIERQMLWNIIINLLFIKNEPMMYKHAFFMRRVVAGSWEPQTTKQNVEGPQWRARQNLEDPL